MFAAFRRYRQNKAVLAAAIRAERWFTHKECIGTHLDFEAFQTADAIRAAVHPIEEDAPHHVRAAEESLPPYGEPR